MPHNILVVDDDVRQIDAYKSLFSQGDDESADALDTLESFFSEAKPNSKGDTKAQLFSHFKLNTAVQGDEAIEKVSACLEAETPIKVAFIDVRMPPGMNGLDAAKKIREMDSRIYIVMVTAYSDFDLSEITQSLQENVLFIRKPFQTEEVEQMALNFVRAWDKDRYIEQVTHTLGDKVKQNLFDASMYEVSNSLLAILADKVNAQAGLISYLSTEFEVLPEQKPDYKEITQTIFGEAQHLSQMVSSLQRLSMSSDKVMVFSLRDLVNYILSLMPELNALPDHIQFEIECHLDQEVTFYLPYSCLILAVSAVIRNALDSVFSQALKTAGFKGSIRLLVEKEGENAIIKLIDNGVGVNKSDLNKVFYDGYSKKEKHSGVGLTLVQQFINRVSGETALYSAGRDKGVEVRLQFPFRIDMT
ncbi:hybrid sensor histidine kinase/response regulator [Hydrogenovibrio sp. 3SP14C1]|uniref:hybrid sensor histidine kinase/response regulator n=1 Tax=Hydrogenovibrio sp. 3SP14C1 TaxID=3038774 RepID=UPI002417A88E|nr:hybrid sensor histidine kinase/response regulator [Hydrogenovibrio sp. 3SP14C1]MDG4812504.1 hybrid sensor histidine kinase/response regulator [Hydrogenovibrio sp. 3SP14C1]